MLKNYLKVAFRSLSRHRFYALLNIIGLGVSLAAAMLISTYAYQELTYDHFHEKAGDIYQVYKERITPTGTQTAYDTWIPMKDALKAEFPSVQAGSRLYEREAWIEKGEEQFQEVVSHVDPAFFELFSFSFEKGNAEKAFLNKNSIILSEEMAAKYFEGKDPLGEVLRLDFEREYTVSGVLKKAPQNATIRPDFMVLISTLRSYDDNVNNWGSAFLDTYLFLQPGSDPKAIETQFPAFIVKTWNEEVAQRTNLGLLPFLKRYDALTGSRKYAMMLLLIAIGILLIAIINFVNLSTARTLDRAREVGMRKVLGARRGQVIGQFLGESVLIGAISLILSIIVVEVSRPIFVEAFHIQFDLDLFADHRILLFWIGMGLFIGLLAGIYPAILFSQYRPIDTFKTKIRTNKGSVISRHVLVTLQFGLSMMLIVGTLVVWRQVEHMQSAELNFDQNNLVVVPVEAGDFPDREEAQRAIDRFKNEAKGLAQVSRVTSSSHIPGSWDGWFTFAIPDGWDAEQPMRLRTSYMDENFFETYGIKLLEGRNFIAGSEEERVSAMIINRAAMEAFGWSSIAGHTVQRGDRTFQVVGLVDDYNFQSLQNEVAPILHMYRAPENGVHNFVSLKLRNHSAKETLEALAGHWKTLAPNREFDYFFVDDRFSRQYETEERLSSIIFAFSVLAIIIACLGMLGLAAYAAERRRKEISIRKVLGASTWEMILMLNKSITWLVLLAFFLSIPVAYLVLSDWLEGFAYRVDFHPLYFLLPGIGTLVIAWLTVSFQSWKTARTNPVEALRDE